MGTDWAEILGGCQSRETEQLLPWSFLKFTDKKVVILQFWVVLSARARARALGQASQSWGAWPPARSKKTSKTRSHARALWKLGFFRARGSRMLCRVLTSTTIYSLDWAFIIEQKLRPHKKISPYGRVCKNGSFCLGQISSFSMMFARLSKSSKNLHYWAKISRLKTPLMYSFRHLLP